MAKVQGLMFGLATLALVVIATVLFSRAWMPPLVSNRVGIDHSIAITLLVTGLVFILTNLLLAYFGWRYQDGEGAKALYWHENPRLEWTWTLVTAGILAFFLFNALSLWAQIQSRPPAGAFVVEVTAQQFAWNARLPGPDGIFGRTRPDLVDPGNLNFIGLDKSDPAAADDIILPQNQLYLPEGQPVVVRLRSLDVIHSFFVPQFRVKQDAVPGMEVETWFVPKQAGDFELACAEHCGLGHYRMRGRVHVVPPDKLDETVKEALE